jgi:FXSXX-COOH protein
LLLTDKQRVGVVDRTAEDDPGAWESVLVDVSDMSLAELAFLAGDPASPGDSPLRRSLRRVAGELAEPDEPIAGFNSAL